MRTNLGRRSAARLQLDFEKCMAGCVIEASDTAGQWLVSQGMATVIEETVKAVPPPVVEAVPPGPLKAYSKKAKKDDSK